MNKRIFVLLALGACVAMGCGDDDDDSLPADTDEPDASDDDDNDGICDLSECEMPEMGIACCTPNGACGFDPTGIGLVCAPHAGEGAVCVLDDCAQPELGNPCCTPFGTCGVDPFANGIFCFANPPDISIPEPDSGTPTCDVDDCKEAEVGVACCLPDGACGTDPFAIGWCFPPAPEVDGGFPDSGLPVLPPIQTAPPDDVSVDGQCPSYLGLFGPVWGCCSEYGVCGTFASETCLLPVGAPLPVEGEDEDDAGMSLPGVLLCDPPTED